MATSIGKGDVSTVAKKKSAKASPKVKGLTEFDGNPFAFSDDAKGTVVLGAFKNGRDVILIMLNAYKGHKKFDIRQAYLDDADDCWHPTGKGVSIRSIDGVHEIMRVLEESEIEIDAHLTTD